MLGLSTAATIFLGSSDTPMIFLYGYSPNCPSGIMLMRSRAILGFAIGAAKYVSQNSEEIIRYVFRGKFLAVELLTIK